MNIDQARENTTHLMNITDMKAIADKSDAPLVLGENQNTIRLVAKYYGGFNLASDTSNFDRLRN